MISLSLRLLPDSFAVCRLTADASLPPWAATGDFFSITRTTEELSIVVSESALPDNIGEMAVELSWRALMVVGPLDFSLTGILAALASPLAAAGIPIFALSTYDTDYLLIKQQHFTKALEVLRQEGHLLLPGTSI